MKIYISLLVLLIVYFNSFAQNIQGKVTYNKVLMTEGTQTIKSIDSCVLYFQNNASLFIENPQFKNVIIKDIKVENEDADFKMNLHSIKKSISYHKNILDDKILQECIDEDNPYFLSEKIPDFNWTITAETKNIGGYDCVKAISDKFRGRVYEAWFTYMIPNSAGPWKLGGLPGLILEASNQKGSVKFAFTSLQIPNQDKVSYEVAEDTTFKTWNEHIKFQQKKIDNKINYYKSLGFEVESSLRLGSPLEDLTYENK